MTSCECVHVTNDGLLHVKANDYIKDCPRKCRLEAENFSGLANKTFAWEMFAKHRFVSVACGQRKKCYVEIEIVCPSIDGSRWRCSVDKLSSVIFKAFSAKFSKSFMFFSTTFVRENLLKVF